MLLHGVLFAITAVNITHIIGNILARYALDFGIARPASRQQESEADYIGLMLMAQACYDPKAAVGFWRRMQRIEKEGGWVAGRVYVYASVGEFEYSNPYYLLLLVF